MLLPLPSSPPGHAVILTLTLRSAPARVRGTSTHAKEEQPKEQTPLPDGASPSWLPPRVGPWVVIRP